MRLKSNLDYTIHPKSADFTPKCVVVMLHGYGSNKDDLVSLAPELAPHLPKETLFISPNAPFKFEGGMPSSYQWYSLNSRDLDFLAQGYQEAHPKLEIFINDILDFYKIESTQLILLGFSQGGMMTLHFGLSYPKPLAALMSCSGYMLDVNIQSPSKPPVFLAHGMLDMVVPVNMFEFSIQKLEEMGIDVTTALSPGLAHGIDYICIDRMCDFLDRVMQ